MGLVHPQLYWLCPYRGAQSCRSCLWTNRYWVPPVYMISIYLRCMRQSEAIWPWAIFLISLCLSFLVCKVMIILSNLTARIEKKNICKVPPMLPGLQYEISKWLQLLVLFLSPGAPGDYKEMIIKARRKLGSPAATNCCDCELKTPAFIVASKLRSKKYKGVCYFLVSAECPFLQIQEFTESQTEEDDEVTKKGEHWKAPKTHCPRKWKWVALSN